MKSWPKEGPNTLWVAEGLGKGFSSAVTSNGRVYTTGEHDFKEILFAFDNTGKELWRKEYSAAHHGGGFPGTRTTPTVHGDAVYVISSLGKVVCMDAASGEERWAVDTMARFAGGDSEKYVPRWAIAESVLIDGNKVICTPGAPEATVAALHKDTGETIWTTTGVSDLSAYCSARIFDNGRIRQIVTLTSKSMLGIDPDSGKLLWTHNYPASWDIHANSPLFFNNIIYVSDGYGHGGKAFRLADDGSGVKEIWKEDTLDIHHGGGVLFNGRIYGASNRGKWMALDVQTGKVVAQGKGTGKGAVVFADGLLYGYGESGRVGIVDPKSDKLDPISQFRVTLGNGQHWAHPTISNGRLYIRHGDVLLCYDLRGK